MTTSFTIAPARRRRRFLGWAASAGSVLLMLSLSGCERPEITFKNTDITGAPYARRLSLTDPAGQKRSLSDFKGKLVVVFFGFTQCPDVCPTTLAELTEVKRALGPEGDRLQVLFITIDPERDTADILKTYVTSFDPGFLGLHGSLEETTEVAKEFKVYFAKVPGKTPNTYTMDHSAGTFVFDTQGQVRLLVRNGAGVAAWVSDLKALLAQSR